MDGAEAHRLLGNGVDGHLEVEDRPGAAGNAHDPVLPARLDHVGAGRWGVALADVEHVGARPDQLLVVDDEGVKNPRGTDGVLDRREKVDVVAGEQRILGIESDSAGDTDPLVDVFPDQGVTNPLSYNFV